MHIGEPPAAMTAMRGWRVAWVGADDSAPGWAAAMLADLGAEEVRVARPADLVTSSRAWDVFLTDARVSAQEESALRRGHRSGIVCSVTPFGGDDAGGYRPGSDLAVQAEAGFLMANGEPDDPPLRCGVPVAAAGGALAAVLAVLAARRALQRPDTGLEVIRIAQVDVLVTFLSTILPHYLLTGNESPRLANRHPLTAPWNAYPARDGWLVIATMGERQWTALADIVGQRLRGERRFGDNEARMHHVDKLDRIIADWTKGSTKAEIAALADAAGVPVSPIQDVTEALSHPQTKYRAERARGVTDQGVFFRSFAPSPPSAGLERAELPTRAVDGDGPLTGLRVLEVGLFTAAPLAGRLLGMLGADVLKLEPPAGEPGRRLGSRLEGNSYLYYINNTDKRGCVIDFQTDEGEARLSGLVAGADVFLTNLSTDSLEAAGLGFDTLAALNPRLVYCSISGYGYTGPFAGRRVLDTVMQAMSGIMHLTGRATGPPMKTAVSICDVLSAWIAAVTVIAAVLERNAALPRPQLVDVSMIDASMWLLRPLLAANGEAGLRRSGNEDGTFLVHGVRRAADGDVALAVADRRALERLREAVLPGSRDDSAWLDSWIATRPAAEVVDTCRRLDIPAGVVRIPSQAASAMLVELPLGRRSHRVIGSPFHWEGRRVGVASAAPALGAHVPRWLSRTREEEARA